MTAQYQFLGDVEGCRRQAAATIEVTRTYGFTLWLALATFLHGWAIAVQGDFKSGMAQMQEGIDLYRATGAASGSAYLAGLLAERVCAVGQKEIAVVVIGEAFAVLERTQDRWCEAELYRLKGELLAQVADPAIWTLVGQTPEECFLQAIAVAHRQGANWWELRALLSLCRLWQDDARVDDLYRQLAACYRRFGEGWALPQLQEARAILVAHGHATV